MKAHYFNTILRIIPTFSVLFLYACGGHSPYPIGGDAGVQQVSVATAQQQLVTLAEDYPGYLTADNSLPLVSRVNGYLMRIACEPGEWVKKGDLLFVIEPTLYENAVSQAQAQLDANQAQWVYAENQYKRSEEAFRSDAVSEIEVIQAKSAMDQAKANVQNALAALSTAKINLGYCYVKAPENGKISVNLYPVGTYINGATSPVTLATLYDDRQVYVNFAIPETRLPQVNQLDSLTLSFGTFTTRYKGKIDYIAPNVVIGTGTVQVRAKLQNSSGVLRDGLYVTVCLPYDSHEQMILVNNNAIGMNQAGNYLYLLSRVDSAGIYTVHIRQVVAGALLNDTLRVIKSGILSGERYVNKALLKVRNGSKIKPIE